MKTTPDAAQTDNHAWPWSRVARILVLTCIVSALGAFGLTALLVNIFERKHEARNPFFRVVEITDDSGDPAVWGKTSPSSTTCINERQIWCGRGLGGRGDAAHIK